MNDDVLTRNDDGELAVRTVSATETSTVVNPNDVYTRDTDGNLAVRVVGAGGGGGDQHNLGYYATQSALEEAHPTATAGDWAIVGTTDTVWIWDEDTSAWKDSNQKGQVTSVNGQTGAVTVQETLVSGTNIKSINGNSILGSGNLSVGGIPQYTTMPTATSSNVGEIAQYSGTTDATYTNGYFYKNVAERQTGTSTISQTTGSGLTDLTVDAATFESQISTTGNYDFEATDVVSYADYTTTTGNTTFSGGDLYQMFVDYGYEGVPNNGRGVFKCLGGDNWQAGPTPTSYWLQIDTSVLESSYGVVVTGTPENGDVIEYVWTEGGLYWEYDGNTVDLNDYGITYTGTAVDGDVLTVSYTQGALVYSWEQIDVQPAPAGGIDWAASIDKPANHDSNYNYESPVWVISGGLPDGDYEFCFQTLVYRNRIDSNYPNGYNQYVTHKARFTILTISDEKYVQGDLAYVIDGGWVVSAYDYKPQNRYVYYFLKIYGDDMIINCNDVPFASQIVGNNFPEEIKDMFKITSIKNINTGEEYIPTGHLYDWANSEGNNWTEISDCYLNESPLVDVPEQKVYNDTLYAAWIPDGYDYLIFSNQNQIVGYPWTSTDSEPKASEVDFVITSSLGGKYHAVIENSSNSYIARILEASGDLANLKLLTQQGKLGAYLNFATTDERSLKATLGLKGSKVEAKCDWDYSNNVQNWTEEIVFDTVGAEITPKNLGVIAQYNEEIPNVAYTKGCFYQATGTVVTVPDAITCEEVDTSIGATITCTDAENFINALINEFNVTRENIEYWLTHGYNQIQYVVGTGGADWNVGYNIPESIITTYFSFSPALQNGDYIIWNMTFTPEHQEVQNPAWTGFNTQPSTTGTTGTLVAANWSSSTQTITVNGVTASNNILVSPAPASSADWASAGILCTAQGTDSLTFTCTQTPSNDITVNVAILN